MKLYVHLRPSLRSGTPFRPWTGIGSLFFAMRGKVLDAKINAPPSL